MRTLTPAEVEVLFDMVQDSPIYPITYTAVSTGLRQAELLGLRWRDIDLDMRLVRCFIKGGVYANLKSLRQATADAA